MRGVKLRVITTIAAIAAILTATPAVRAQLPAKTAEIRPLLWRDAGGDTRYRIARHESLSHEARSGQAAEFVRLIAENGTGVYLAREIPPARIIEELNVEVWVKSDRPGIQLLARLVLPRARDPKTGRPLTTMVRGTNYTKVGLWQPLRLDRFPWRLDEVSRRLRATRRENVDIREAYVDQLVLNIYGGPGTTDLWIDRLRLSGMVNPTALPAENARRASVSYSASRPTESKAATVALHGSVLTVNNRPLFARVIEFRGEPLEQLAKIGFNTVRFASLPSRAQLSEAERLGLWVICPPPVPPPANDGTSASAKVAEITDAYRQVLVWDLGQGLADSQLARVRQWARMVRQADRRLSRPLIAQAESDLRAYSRHVDILLFDRRPLGTGLELADYERWLRERPRLARPGTPFWATIQTEPAATVEAQIRGVSGSADMLGTVEPEQIRLLVQTAIGAGARGLYFPSRTRLDRPDRATRRRRLALEWTNLELDFIEPWATAATRLSEIESPEPAIRGAVLKTGHARLALPMWVAPGSQYTAGQAAGTSVSIIVPGVPESHRAFILAPGGLQSVRAIRRVTGGVRLTLDEMDTTSMIVLSQDPLAYSQLSTRLQAAGARAAKLIGQLAADRFQSVGEVERQLALRATAGSPEIVRLMARAGEQLRLSESRLAAGDHGAADQYARRAMRFLRHIARYRWENGVERLATPISNPLAVGYQTLPLLWQTMPQWFGRTDGENCLAGGDFESLDQMDWAGWQHFTYEQPGIATEAELSPKQPHSGRYSLRLRASTEEDTPIDLVGSPPVWVTSGAVPVEAGTWVRIDGWVRISQAVTGSVDQLMIFDSLGGAALAYRVAKTDGWQPLTLYRFASKSGTLSLTIALSGLGEAWIDDLRVTPLGSPRRHTAQAPPHTPTMRRLPPLLR